MARIIVTADESTRSSSWSRDSVLLDERVSSIHLHDDHSTEQLIQRLAWAVSDAESAERSLQGSAA